MRIEYPADLQVSGARDKIMAAIRDHQVVIVAGATGSGKTTQLPKMCGPELDDAIRVHRNELATRRERVLK